MSGVLTSTAHCVNATRTGEKPKRPRPLRTWAGRSDSAMKTSRWGGGSGPLDLNACHGEPISGSGISDGALCLVRQHRLPHVLLNLQLPPPPPPPPPPAAAAAAAAAATAAAAANSSTAAVSPTLGLKPAKPPAAAKSGGTPTLGLKPAIPDDASPDTADSCARLMSPIIEPTAAPVSAS